MYRRNLLIPALLATFCLVDHAVAQSITSLAHPQARVLQSINEFNTVTLAGNVHPLVATASLSSAADDSTPMEHMVLFLKGDATQETQLAQLIAQQNDPKSPLFHKFLTPEQFGPQFGVAQTDLVKVTTWLQSHGFKVEDTPVGNRAIVFSGTAAQTAAAFNTEIKHYTIAGVKHYANSTDPKIPAALASVVGGVVKLHDFQHTANIAKSSPVSAAQLANPLYTYGSGHYLSPADYSTIYDIGPLYSNNINGTGQTIAVLARSNIYLSDVQSFRSMFGLKANNPQIIITNSDPGVLQGDSVETTLDTEWSGAIAPNATVKVIVAASTNTADGIDLSALYAVNNNVAPVISLSYGSCEASMGASELAFYNSLWQQAAAQGISVMVSSGDSGAAGCYGGSSSSGSGKAINGLCSSPYATCVGGTEFVEGSNPGQYWLPGNNATYGSAISYLPETVWNESGSNGGSGLWAGGGGASITYAKPTWQTGPGVLADGHRDVPDVSMTASSHDGYLIMLSGGLNSVGGTSAAAPSFAGLMALVNQKANARQGLANLVLYPLAAGQASGGAAVFHDIKTGNNSVPGVTGFVATMGYDLASGLGSVDATQLVNHWADGSTAASLSLSSSSTALTVSTGQSGQLTVTSTANAALKSAVTLSMTGAPTGVTATFTPATIASPGSGTSTVKITAATSAAPGTYSLTVTGTGGGQTAKVTLSVTLVVPTFSFSASASAATVIQGNATSLNVATTTQNGFNSTVALSVAGLPSGVTAAFSPTTITGTAGGSSALTLTVAKTTKTGSYPLTITAAGGGVTKTSSFTLVVTPATTCTFSINPTSLSLTAGQAGSVQIACSSPQGTFSGPLALSVSGSPTGITAKLASATLTPGSTGTLSLSSTATTAAGKYTLSLTASGSGFSQTVSLPLTVTAPVSTLSLSASASTLSLKSGSTAQVNVTSTHGGVFNSQVNLSVAALPAGVTASLSKTLLAAPGDGTIVATFSATSSVTPGTYSVTITGTGGGQTAKLTLSLTIVVPTFSLSASATTATVIQGNAANLTVTTTTQNGFSSAMALSVTGLPSGVTAAFSPATITGTAGGSSALTLTVAKTTKAGSYPLTITATGGGVTKTSSFTLVVSVPASCTFSINPTSLSLTAGQAGSVQIACSSPQGTFSGPLAVSVSGSPTGIIAKLTSATLTPGSTGTLSLSSTATAAAGKYALSLTASGSGFSQTVSLPLTVTAPGTLSLSASQSTLAFAPGGNAQVSVTSAHGGPFNSQVSFSVTGLPAGVTASLSKTVLAAPGDGTIVATFTATSSVKQGTYAVSVVGTGGTLTQSVPLTLSIGAVKPDFSFAVNVSSLAVAQGAASSPLTVSVGNFVGGFNSTITLMFSGLPPGMSYYNTAATTGNNLIYISFAMTASSSTPVGTYPITISATATGIAHSGVVQVTVTKAAQTK